MPYDILLGEHALDRVAAANLPPAVIDGLEVSLRSLAADPVNRSRRSSFPYPSRGQMYPFRRDHAGVRYDFVVFFCYAEDEQALKVFDVTVTAASGPRPQSE